MWRRKRRGSTLKQQQHTKNALPMLERLYSGCIICRADVRGVKPPPLMKKSLNQENINDLNIPHPATYHRHSPTVMSSGPYVFLFRWWLECNRSSDARPGGIWLGTMGGDGGVVCESPAIGRPMPSQRSSGWSVATAVPSFPTINIHPVNLVSNSTI